MAQHTSILINWYGGAIFLRSTHITYDGGALYSVISNQVSTINATHLTLIGNAVRRAGGAMYVSNGNVT